MGGLLGLLGVGFVAFVIYFIFKQIQFFLTATDLYKKMVEQQGSMIQLLLDIRGGSKQFQPNEYMQNAAQADVSTQATLPSDAWKCRCGTVNAKNDSNCSSCKRVPGAIY